MSYFGYGSNMNHQQMKRRCPGSKFITRVRLDGFRFGYDGHSTIRGGAVANILESSVPGAMVWGGLFEVTEPDLAILDRYEGYPRSYRRIIVTVRDDRGVTYEAIVYCRTGEVPGEPSEKYRAVIIQGAKDCGLPDTYITSTLGGRPTSNASRAQ